MKKLEDHIDIIGTGIPNLKGQCLARTSKKAIYLRNDLYYEVFYIHIEKEREAFGKIYPEREIYPGNDAFGKSAWCFKDRERAFRKYETL